MAPVQKLIRWYFKGKDLAKTFNVRIYTGKNAKN